MRLSSPVTQLLLQQIVEFERRNISKPHIPGPLWGNSMGTGEFQTQRDIHVEGGGSHAMTIYWNYVLYASRLFLFFYVIK